MILEPSKTAEEIDRRLSALTDPELAQLLQAAGRSLQDNDPDSYTSLSAPYWKRRIGLVALAGLLALSIGYGYNGALAPSHQSARPKAQRALASPVRRHRKVALHHNVAKHQAARIVPAEPRTKPAPVAPIVVAPAPNEALIRQMRAQLLHQRTLQEKAQADAARAQHQAKVAMQARAQAQEQALHEALAQARAEALAQARAEALARAQAESADAARAQEWAVQNASGEGTKPGAPMPPANGHLSTYPNPNTPPAPGPGPIDPNCTPHRGSLFTTMLTGAVLSHVRVGGTNAGELLRLVHP
jgi:hypothetical protein